MPGSFGDDPTVTAFLVSRQSVTRPGSGIVHRRSSRTTSPINDTGRVTG